MSNLNERERVIELFRTKSEHITIQDANASYMTFGHVTVISDGIAWANELEN